MCGFVAKRRDVSIALASLGTELPMRRSDEKGYAGSRVIDVQKSFLRNLSKQVVVLMVRDSVTLVPTIECSRYEQKQQ
jgi:hypothetical protein